VTEQELLKNFEEYRKILQELEARYKIPPATEPLREAPEPVYISEPVFFYQVHTST
jgi:hypothetical protein